MKMPAAIEETMLAPCGLDCTACYAHLRRKSCPGCRGAGRYKVRHCDVCAIASLRARAGARPLRGLRHLPLPRIKRLAKTIPRALRGGPARRLAARREAVGTEQYLREERSAGPAPAAAASFPCTTISARSAGRPNRPNPARGPGPTAGLGPGRRWGPAICGADSQLSASEGRAWGPIVQLPPSGGRLG